MLRLILVLSWQRNAQQGMLSCTWLCSLHASTAWFLSSMLGALRLLGKNASRLAVAVACNVILPTHDSTTQYSRAPE